MTESIRKLLCALRSFIGAEAAGKILFAAYDSLTLEERAAIGRAFIEEEKAYARWAAKCLRAELANALPAASHRTNIIGTVK
jgi:hypothetical protein